jgi:branched-chain amino acid transport system ATP-binding protein
MTAHSMSDPRSNSPGATTEPADNLLEARGVTKQFEGLIANRAIDFDIPRHSIVSMIGPNGAGKTTFFNQLSGVYHPTAGTITLGGVDISN